MHKVSNWLWGIVLIALGVILGVNALGWAQIDIFFPGWWTLFLIVPCFIDLFNPHEDKVGNVVGILIGVALMLGCLGVLNFGMVWRLLVPVLLVVIGLSFIFKDALKKKIMKGAKHLDDSEKHEYWSTFGGQKINFDDQKFEGAVLNAVFGGIALDLRKAKIEDGAAIKASSTFGGITIRVPKDVAVKVATTGIFGGTTNRRDQDTEDVEKTIYVDANCLFGGVEVK